MIQQNSTPQTGTNTEGRVRIRTAIPSETSKREGFFRSIKKEESNPEYENFQDVLKKVLSVPKEELDKRRAEYEREKKEKRAR